MSQIPRIFIAYARQDAHLLEKLRKPLNVLRRNQHCDIFYDGEIVPGERWDERLKAELHRADIFVLLVTDDFLDSDYINDVELPEALEEERQGRAKVVPVILRHCMWEFTLLSKFQVVLHEGRPIEPSDGYVHAAKEIVRVIEQRNDALRRALEEEQERLEAERLRLEALAAEEHRKKEKQERLKKEAKEAARLKREAEEKEEARLKKEAEDRREDEEQERLKKEAEPLRKEGLAISSKEAYDPVKDVKDIFDRMRARKKKEAEDLRKEVEEARRLSLDHVNDLMVRIEGGTFLMGSQTVWGRFWDNSDFGFPIHKVTVKDFHLGKFPVTQAQWRAVMGDDPPELHFKGCDQCPVEGVSWNDVQFFLKKLNEKTGAGYRLPSEAEWEYAARGGSKSKGFKYAGSNNLDEVGWFRKNSGDKTHSVGDKKANELGIFDMSGNVWEWCEDTWHDSYQGTPADGSAWADSQSDRRVVRGGSSYNDAVYCRPAHRNRFEPGYRSYLIGFRLCLPLQ